MLTNILTTTRNSIPLTHAITNFVTVNDVANIILACGGTPAMAKYKDDSIDLQKLAASLLLNIGDITPMLNECMLASGKIANALNHPIILDPVAVGATKYRDMVAKELTDKLDIAVIRGNISEIKALYLGSGSTKGVDANIDDVITEANLNKNIIMAKEIAAKFNAVIAISGAIDIVCDSNTAYIIRNGHFNMTKITGSGCMATGVIAAFVGANKDNILDATATAMIAIGLCGELAEQKRIVNNTGLNSFRTYLIDYMSLLDEQTLLDGAKYEVR